MLTVNGKNFKEEVLDAAIPVIADLQAPGCGYCRRLAPAVEKMEQEVAGKIKVVTIDIDADPELAEQFNVMTIPTLILFCEGKAVGTVVNPANRNAIDGWLKENGISL